MNTIKLIQRHILCCNEYWLDDKFLVIEERSITEIKRKKIRLDDIGHKLKVEKENEFVTWAVFIFIGLTSFFLVIINVIDHSQHFPIWVWIFMSVSCIWLATLFFLTPRTNKITLVYGSEPVEFMLDKPSEKEVRTFIEEAIKRSSNLLIHKFSPDPDLPEETVLYQLQWLRNMEIIDNDEFFEMKRIYYSGLNRINTD